MSHKSLELSVLAASPKGLNVRATRSLRLYPPSAVIEAHPSYQAEMVRVQARISAGTAFDGWRQAVVQVDILNGEFVFHCQPIKYSVSCAISAYVRHQRTDNEALFPVEPSTGTPSQP